jgi:methenyltetrahydrofolate cyclohydrolase
MLHDPSQTLAHFLDAAAARQPAPGGGSVTALVGALAAAMGEMVLNYSIGKKGLEPHQEQLKTALAEFHRARRLLLDLMVEDQVAYQALTAARKLVKGSPHWLVEHPPALLASIRVPETIAATGQAVLELCDRLINQVNFYLLSDLAVCAELAMATIRCGVYNVRINLSDEVDPQERSRVETTLTRILSQGTRVIQQVIPRIWQRHGQGA